MSTRRNYTKNTLKQLQSITGGPLTLGELLRAIRLGEELTQEEFSKKTGLSKQHVSDIEHGRRFVSPRMAVKLAKKLGYSADQFVRLSLQDTLNRYGIHYIVEVRAA